MSLNLLKSLEFSSWAPEMSQSLREDAIQHLESGGVLYLPHLGYALNQDQQKFLSPSWSDGKAKNISLRPNKNAPGDTFKGAQGTPEQLSALQAILIDYRSQACNLIQAILPGYMEHLKIANTSYRPFEVAGRQSSYRKDDTRLHVDSFPSNPTGGTRLLRVFTNVNPYGRPRSWRLGEPFEQMAEQFLPKAKTLWPGQSWLMHQLHITKRVRSEYDHLMLQLHDFAKADMEYQNQCPQQAFDFPAGSSWIVYSDQVMHAAMSGQYLMEQTFHLPVSGLYQPQSSPLKILERKLGRSLV